MKTIISRLRRLEERVADPNFGGPSPAEVLWERRRRRLEAEGLPFEERPPEPGFHTHGSGVLDAEVLLNARARRWAESQRAEVGQQ
jgi:hypothetical protein